MNTKRWNKIRKFEDLYNRKLLQGMSAQESFKMLTRLYELGAGLAGKRRINAIDTGHISGILKVRSRLKVLSE